MALFGCVAAYLIIVTVQFASEWLASRFELRSLRAATKLNPWNADYYRRLGRYYDWVGNECVDLRAVHLGRLVRDTARRRNTDRPLARGLTA